MGPEVEIGMAGTGNARLDGSAQGIRGQISPKGREDRRLPAYDDRNGRFDRNFD